MVFDLLFVCIVFGFFEFVVCEMVLCFVGGFSGLDW